MLEQAYSEMIFCWQETSRNYCQQGNAAGVGKLPPEMANPERLTAKQLITKEEQGAEVCCEEEEKGRSLARRNYMSSGGVIMPGGCRAGLGTGKHTEVFRSI